MTEDIFPIKEAHQLVGRTIKNAFGTDEIAAIPQNWWDYFDWCIDHGLDMNSLLQELDETRPQNVTFSVWVWTVLWEHNCVRLYHGYPCPSGPPPRGYEGFVAAIDKRADDEENYEWSGRFLTNALGAKEVVTMRQKYWDCYDYLVERGGDMDKWVVDADIARHTTQNKNDLSTEMMASLRRFERNMYLKGANFLLFISPRGYPRTTKKSDSK